MTKKALELIRNLPSNEGGPMVTIAIVAALKEAITQFASEPAGTVDTYSQVGSPDDLEAKKKTIQYQAAPKLPAGGITYITLAGERHPAVVTARHEGIVTLLVSLDSGATYSVMMPNVKLADSESSAANGQAFTPGT